MARRQQSFPVSRRSARLTTWVGPALQSFVSVTTGGATLVGSFQQDQPFTVMRTRGQMTVRSTTVGADLSIVGAFGIGIVSQEAFDAGVVSMPEPFTDADWGGWMVHELFAFDFEFADVTGVNFNPWSRVIDSKAMRKVSANEVLVQIAESFGGAFEIGVPTRMLIKLA